MFITIYTADPDHVDVDEIRELIAGAGYYVDDVVLVANYPSPTDKENPA